MTKRAIILDIPNVLIHQLEYREAQASSMNIVSLFNYLWLAAVLRLD